MRDRIVPADFDSQQLPALKRGAQEGRRNIEVLPLLGDRTAFGFDHSSPTRFAAPLPGQPKTGPIRRAGIEQFLNGHFHHLSERITARGSPDQSAFALLRRSFGFPPSHPARCGHHHS